MLNQSSVKASFALSDKLAARGMSLLTKPNTVLHELVRATNAIPLSPSVIENMNNGDSFDIASYGKFIETITGNPDTPTTHDMLMDGYLDDLSKAISSHLSFARNVVKSVVIDYSERVKQAIQNHTFVGAESQFTITTVAEPEVLKDPVFLHSIEPYAEKSALIPDYSAFLIEFTVENITQALLTNEKEIDAKIVEWLSNLDLPKITHHLNEIFRSPESGIKAYMPGMMTDLTNIDLALAIYLVASNGVLRTDVFAPNIKISASIAKTNLAQFRDFSAALLCKLLKQAEMYRRSGTLILTKFNKEIVVFNDVYQQWLNTGGTTEELLAVVSGRFDIKRLDQITAKREALQAEWRAYQMFYHSTQSNRRLTIVKSILEEQFHATMNDFHEEEQTYINQAQDYMAGAFKRLTTILDELRLSDIEDINKLALKIICRCRFHYTEAEFILSEIEEVAKDNPEIDIYEAAMIATVHYLVDYLCYQMYLTPKV